MNDCRLHRFSADSRQHRGRQQDQAGNDSSHFQFLSHAPVRASSPQRQLIEAAGCFRCGLAIAERPLEHFESTLTRSDLGIAAMQSSSDFVRISVADLLSEPLSPLDRLVPKLPHVRNSRQKVGNNDLGLPLIKATGQ